MIQTFFKKLPRLLAILLIVGSFIFSLNLASAQGPYNSSTKADGGGDVRHCYSIKLELLKDGKFTADTKVKVSEASRYELKVNIVTGDGPMDQYNNPCPSGVYSLQYAVYTDSTGTHPAPVSSGYLAQDVRVNDKKFTQTYKITNPSQATYTYTLTWKGGLRPPLEVSINVTYTNDKGVIDPKAAPPTNDPKPKPEGPAPNTNVGVGLDPSLTKGFDTDLGGIFNPLEKDTLPELLAALLRILFTLVGIVAVIIIIVAGFRMVMAAGNEDQLTKAKKAITWAIIGLVVSLMAFSIVAIIQKLIQG